MPTAVLDQLEAGPRGKSWLAALLPSSTAGGLAAMVLVGLAVRLVVVAFTYRGLPNAADHYQQFGWEMGWVARSIASGRGFSSPFFERSGPTALLPPLFPYLLAAIFRVFGVYTVSAAAAALSLNSLLSALTCVPVYFIAKNGAGVEAARWAGWAWAVYPFAVYFSAARVWDYALTSLLFAICFLLAQTMHLKTRRAWPWLGFGALYGVAALSNPSVLSLFPFLVGLALLKSRQTWRRRLTCGLLAVVGIVAVAAPWTVRNYRTMHILCPVRDNFWLEFWAGNTGDTREPNASWAHPASNPAEMRKFQEQAEAGYLAQKRSLAIALVRQRPAFFLVNSLRRASYFWTGFWTLDPYYTRTEPFQTPNVFFCGSVTLLMLLGLRSWWHRDRAGALPYIFLLLVFPLAYYITHPAMDYRQPIEPEIVVLAVVGLLTIRRRIQGWRGGRIV